MLVGNTFISLIAIELILAHPCHPQNVNNIQLTVIDSYSIATDEPINVLG